MHSAEYFTDFTVIHSESSSREITKVNLDLGNKNFELTAKTSNLNFKRC